MCYNAFNPFFFSFFRIIQLIISHPNNLIFFFSFLCVIMIHGMLYLIFFSFLVRVDVMVRVAVTKNSLLQKKKCKIKLRMIGLNVCLLFFFIL